MKKVTPQVYLIGYTNIDLEGLLNYLEDTNQQEFQELMVEAEEQGLCDGEILCSFYAKLCYKSLVLGKNANIAKIRNIQSNFETIIESGHGAVLEHFCINFVVTNCSRIFSHEQVRHRVGTAYSQTSGRYVALGVDNEGNDIDLEMVIDPVLQPVIADIEEAVNMLTATIRSIRHKLDVDNMSFKEKKRVTSAIRRLAPNGQANEIGISLNLRSLRNIIEQRTSRHAEWEIRLIYNQITEIVLAKWPHILFGYSREIVDDLYEYINLRV